MITNKTMPEADARAIAAEIKIRISDRREAGLRELQTLATTVRPRRSCERRRIRKRERGEDKLRWYDVRRETKSHTGRWRGTICSTASSTKRWKK